MILKSTDHVDAEKFVAVFNFIFLFVAPICCILTILSYNCGKNRKNKSKRGNYGNESTDDCFFKGGHRGLRKKRPRMGKKFRPTSGQFVSFSLLFFM